MKYFLIIGSLAWLAACGSKPSLEPYVADYNVGTASVVRLSGDTTTIALTDYIPTFEAIDSVTSSMKIVPLSQDWSRFNVIASGESLSLIDVWKGGAKVSLVAQADSASDLFIYSAKSDDRLRVAYNKRPEQLIAMWQNVALPDGFISESEGGYEITIPSEAATTERSFLRVFAADESGVSNDMLVPLSSGRVVSSAQELTRTDRHYNIIYSLMVDRFNNGDKSNDWKINSPQVLDIVDYQGGDIAGITEKIRSGFFSDLGVNTIWISPIIQNPYDAWGFNKNPSTKFTGYHGYWPIHLTALERRFSTEDQLREMLDVAHENGINVLMDYVANHLHIDSPILKEHPDWKTPLILPDGRKNLELWDEQRLTTWFDLHIPSLDLANPEVYEPMTDSAMYWFKNFDFDGVRHDATKHIPEIFWQTLTRKIKTQMPEKNLYQIGETYGSPELIGSYVKSGMLDGQFDFNVYDAAIGEIGRPDGSFAKLTKTLNESLSAYGYHNLMGYITGNHDRPRFISLAGGSLSFEEDSKAAGWQREITVGDSSSYDKLSLLHALIMTIPGIPCVYQGDEYGVPGGNDPDNRHMMVFDKYTPKEAQVKKNITNLTQIRRASMPLLYGDLLPLQADDDVMVFARIYMGQIAVVALNKSAIARTISVDVPVDVSLQSLKPNFNNLSEVSQNRITLTLKPLSFEILN